MEWVKSHANFLSSRSVAVTSLHAIDASFVLLSSVSHRRNEHANAKPEPEPKPKGGGRVSNPTRRVATFRRVVYPTSVVCLTMEDEVRARGSRSAFDDVRSYQSCSRSRRRVSSRQQPTSRFRHPRHAHDEEAKKKCDCTTKRARPRSEPFHRPFVIRQMGYRVGPCVDLDAWKNEPRRGEFRGGSMCRVLNPDDLSIR